MSNSTLIFTNFSKFINKEMIENTLNYYGYHYTQISFNSIKHTCTVKFDSQENALNFRFNFHLTKFIGKKTVYISFLNNNKKNDPLKEVFVGKLDKSIEPKDFYVFFNAIRKIEDFKLAENENGESNGHAWIQFFTKNDAKFIIEHYNGYKLGNQKIEVCQFDLNKKLDSDINKNINNIYNPNNNIIDINSTYSNPISIRISNIPNYWELKDIIQYFKQYNINNIIFSGLKIDRNKTKKVAFGNYYGIENDDNYFKLMYEIPYYEIEFYNENKNKNIFNLNLKNFVLYLKKYQICSQKEDYFKFAHYILENNLQNQSAKNMENIYQNFIKADDFIFKKPKKHLVINKLIPKDEMKEKEANNLKNVKDENEENEIYVSYLPPYYSDNHLKHLFSKFGGVKYCYVRKNLKNINNKLITCVYGYVFMKNKENIEKAIHKLNGTKIDKRFFPIKVEKYKKKKNYNNNYNYINNNNNMYNNNINNNEYSEENLDNFINQNYEQNLLNRNYQVNNNYIDKNLFNFINNNNYNYNNNYYYNNNLENENNYYYNNYIDYEEEEDEEKEENEEEKKIEDENINNYENDEVLNLEAPPPSFI